MRQPAAVLLALSVIAASALAQDPPLREAHPGDDYIVREAMVPMRDGVRLYTLILTPKNAKGPLPILLERTPYDATRALSGTASLRLEVVRGRRYLGGGYIFATQDLRGRFKSEGEYAMYRRAEWYGTPHMGMRSGPLARAVRVIWRSSEARTASSKNIS